MSQILCRLFGTASDAKEIREEMPEGETLFSMSIGRYPHSLLKLENQKKGFSYAVNGIVSDSIKGLKWEIIKAQRVATSFEDWERYNHYLRPKTLRKEVDYSPKWVWNLGEYLELNEDTVVVKEIYAAGTCQKGMDHWPASVENGTIEVEPFSAAAGTIVAEVFHPLSVI